MANISDYLRAGLDGDVNSSAAPRAPSRPMKTGDQLRAQMSRIIKKARSAKPQPAVQAPAVSAAAGKIPFMMRGGGIPGMIAMTVGSMALAPIIERLAYGSREDQMREQFNLQRKLEMEQMGGMAGGMPSGVAQPVSDPALYELLESQRMLDSSNNFASSRNRTLESLMRPSGSEEMERLLAGDEARIRSIQSERGLTPYEIMGIING